MSEYKMNSDSKIQIWQNPWHFLAFGYGTGISPIAPGTVGSLVGLVYYALLAGLGWPLYITVTIVLAIFGIWLCDKVSQDLGVHDHRGIVWDEIVGVLLTFLFVKPSIANLIIGFLLFRLFDIWKPWPIKWADKSVKGGLGIMLDDILAAIPAWLCLQCFIWVW